MWQVNKEPPVQPEPLALREPLEQAEPQAHPELPVSQELPEPMAQSVPLAHQVHLVLLEHPPPSLAQQVPPARKDHKVSKENQALLHPSARLEHRGQVVHQDNRELPDPKETRVSLGQQQRLEQRGLRVLPGQVV